MSDLDAAARIVNRLSEPAMLVDHELNLISCNAAYVSLTEIDVVQLELLDLIAIFAAPEHREVAQACMTARRTQQVGETVVRSRSGRHRIVDASFVPLIDDARRPLGLLYLLRDVTTAVELRRKHELVISQERERNRQLEDRDEMLQEDLSEAKLFQQSLLPVLPRVEGFEVSARFLPAEQVSGDLYDVHEIRDGIRVMVADATGHGVQASLRTMVIRTEYDTIKQIAPDPVTLLQHLNHRFAVDYSRAQLHFTACCFDLIGQPGGALLRYSSAGHPGLMWLTAGMVSELWVPGPYPGVVAPASFELFESRLSSGDRLFAFTDGFLDQSAADGTRLDESRVMGDVAGSGTLDQALDRAMATINGFVAGRGLTDDITVVGVEVR